MTNTKTIRAGLIVIGNEVLSGRTQDTNTNHIAKTLTDKGIRLTEVRVVPDVLDHVAEAVNALRSRYDYVFTTGGIGPTHDDITVDCIAAAFGVPVITHPEAFDRLKRHYAEGEFNEARQRMARTPEGADLIDNPVSTAPGFVIENVYSMAGVPRIMKAMLENILISIDGGDVIQSRTISCDLPESTMSPILFQLQDEHPSVDIGSYPFFNSGNTGTSLVLRSTSAQDIDTLAPLLFDKITALGGHPKYLD